MNVTAQYSVDLNSKLVSEPQPLHTRLKSDASTFKAWKRIHSLLKLTDLQQSKSWTAKAVSLSKALLKQLATIIPIVKPQTNFIVRKFYNVSVFIFGQIRIDEGQYILQIIFTAYPSD